MTNTITIEEQVHAVELANRCTRLLSLDMIWTGRMNAAGHDGASPEDLAYIAREMATEIHAIRDDINFAREFAQRIVEAMGSIDDSLVKSLASITEETAGYIYTYGPQEADKLLAKAEISLKGGFPEGDVGRRFWGAVSAIGGVLTIGGGAACVVVMGPAGLPILTAAAAVGGPLLGSGIGVLLEAKKEKERSEEEEAREARARKATEKKTEKEEK